FSATHAPTTQTHTLSLHDALPISRRRRGDGRGERPSDRALPDEPGAAAGRARGPLDAPHDGARGGAAPGVARAARGARLLADGQDRKSTRLNSSHVSISYAVFCLK